MNGESLRNEGVDMRDEDPLEKKVNKFCHWLPRSGPLSRLAQCRRLVIRFNNGVVHYRKPNAISAHYHPIIDGRLMTGVPQEGSMMGYTSVLIGAMIKGIASAFLRPRRRAARGDERANQGSKNWESTPCFERCLAGGLRLGVALDYMLFDQGFSKKDLTQPRPHEELFEKWGKRPSNAIEMASMTLPEDLGLLRHWNRVEGYCRQGQSGDVTPEMAAIEIVRRGLDQVSRTPIRKLCRHGSPEADFEPELHALEIQIVKTLEGPDPIAEYRETLEIHAEANWDEPSLGPGEIEPRQPRFYPPWAPRPKVFLPYVKLGTIETVDPDEIVSLYAIKNLIDNYQKHRHRHRDRPLSIAVFGPPGSGKSFTIKQILREPESKALRDNLEFNLAQFTSLADLETAFHRAQDIVLGGETPLMVFDEFDTSFGGRKLGWLQYFLPPMQDGLFKSGQHIYRTGRAIFVFTGGVFHHFDRFEETCMKDEESQAAKGPDFISRLRGHLNIKGIDSDVPEVPRLLLFRRAILLRHYLQKHLEHAIFDKDTNTAKIDPEVIKAFLKVHKYKHGPRSMEAIVQMASISPSRKRFQKSSLPPADQLEMHVDSEEFLRLVYGSPLPGI